MRIYVLRHGESAIMRWRMDHPDAEVVDAQYLPDSEAPLSGLGDEQVEALSLYFAALPEAERPTLAFSSPFVRARQTGAGAIRRLSPEVELVVDERLREIDFGVFEGLTKKGRAAKFPEQWGQRRKVGKVHYRPPGGENWHDVAARLGAFRKERIDVLPASAVVLLSTHEIVVGVSQWQWAQEDIEKLGTESVPTASITCYDFDGVNFTLVSKHVLPPSPTGRNLFSTESKADDR